MTFEEFKNKCEIEPVESFPNKVLENPLVSVFILTYQHVNYIKKCLDGILMQKTTFSYEIIIGEDCSSDGTREICEEYALKHPDKIRLYLHKRENNIKVNGKPTGRFNFLHSIYSCTGKYMAFCEGDDYWTNENKLQKQIDFMETNPDYSICFHNAMVLWEDKNKEYLFRKNSWFKDTYTTEEVIGRHFMPSASLVFRLPKKVSFPEWILYIGSGDIALTSIFSAFGKSKFLEEPMCIYRKHPGGISRTRKGWNFFLLRIVLLYHLNSHFNYKYDHIIQQQYKEFIQIFLFSETKSGKIFSRIGGIAKKGLDKVFNN